MTVTNQVSEVFADAHSFYASALERLEARDIRGAAGKAWCATLWATNALILARTWDEPREVPTSSTGLKQLAKVDAAVRPLVVRYFRIQAELHGECFYLGFCEPEDEMEQEIRACGQFISDAEALAGTGMEGK